jgi:hypothetical protein
VKRFIPTYLDPATRLGEVLFGLIMVLTFTLAAGFAVSEDKAGVRELLLAAIGCNLAWGIIDAVMYLMSCLTERAGKLRLAQAVRSAPDATTAMAAIDNEIASIRDLLPPEEAQALGRTILKHVTGSRTTSKNHLTKEDFYGAIACFVLVFVSCLPAVLPFVFLSEPRFALRVSNALLTVLLFLVGWKWARYAGTNPLLAGLVMVAIGLALVGTAIWLGG